MATAKKHPKLNDVARLLWPLECDFAVRRYVKTQGGNALTFVRVAVTPDDCGALVGLLNAAGYSWHTGTQQEAPRHFISIPINADLEGN